MKPMHNLGLTLLLLSGCLPSNGGGGGDACSHIARNLEAGPYRIDVRRL